MSHIPPTIEPSGTEDDKELVYSWLREFNREENPGWMTRREATERLFLVARDGEGAVVGGLEGEIRPGWLRVDIMSVAPELRRGGVGRALIEAAERIAAARGCRRAYVDTMDYQAPGFYRGQGYAEVGRLEDWDSQGHDKLFFVKRLTD